MTTLQAFFILLVFQSAGAILKAATSSPLPGPLLGMALLTLWLMLRQKRAPYEGLERLAGGLLGWLGLLFVPAGVGVVANLTILRAAWLPITVGLIGSTLVTSMVTAFVMHALQRRGARKGAV